MTEEAISFDARIAVPEARGVWTVATELAKSLSMLGIPATWVILERHIQSFVTRSGGQHLTVAAKNRYSTPSLDHPGSWTVHLTPSSLRLWGTRTAVLFHDLRHVQYPGEFSPLRRAARSAIYRRNIKRSNRVLAISEQSARALRTWIPGAVPHVVELGVDHLRLDVKDTRDTLIIYNHWSNKRGWLGVEAAGSAASILAAAGVQRVIVLGEEVAAPAALNDLETSGIVYSHYSFLPDGEYHEALSSARMVIMPSTLEGFGLAYGEALANGISAVGVAGSGVERFSRYGATVAEAGRVDAVRTAIVEALSSTVRPSEVRAALSWSNTSMNLCRALDL